MKEKITVSIFVICVVITGICACMMDSPTLLPGMVGMLSTLIAVFCVYYLNILAYREEHKLHKKGNEIKWDL